MQITLTQPDDWHLHLRDAPYTQAVVGDTAQRFARALIMPNLTPPVTTVAQALAYRQRILSVLPEASQFNPLMTLYLTAETRVEEIQHAAQTAEIIAAKLYPAGATTNSAAGIKDISSAMPVFEAMADAGLVLCVHGEVVDPEVDIFDREKRFIDTILAPLTQRLPELKVVMEHITTADAVAFVSESPATVAATLTPQHLLYNRNALLVGGIRPHYYCLPILKREQHRQALVAAATVGNPKFFLGTDSAPHTRNHKESSCGCAGIYSAHCAIELYAEVFDKANALPQLEGFASHFGADFYGLERNTRRITLSRQAWQVEEAREYGDDTLIPLRAGEQVAWRLITTDTKDAI